MSSFECFTENYAVRFLPTENGIHSVEVFFKDSPIPGSPFRLRVGTVEEVGDPGHVHAYGEGLERGKTGQFLSYMFVFCLFNDYQQFLKTA